MSDLSLIPGVGSKTVEMLNKLGYSKIEDLRDVNPDDLYEMDSFTRGYKPCVCQLYVYRCAVWYAENGLENKEKQWNHFKN